MLKLAQTDRPTDRPTDRAKTILYLRVPGVHIGSSPNIGKLSRIQWVFMMLKKIHNHIRIFHHGDWTINATEAPPLGGHVFHDIIGTLYRVLKRFFESRTIAPTDNRSYAKFDKADSRSYDVLTGRTERLSALSKHRRSDCPPCQNIVGATVRPVKFSVGAIVCRSDCPDTRKNAPPPGAHVFEPTGTIFELAQDIILTNLLTKFHDDGQKTGTIF
ncbi:hypothetical protein DPMN_100873 [Dreissena polymorpha]|uniref:Uncharacterized protein n=1 Tax=Dreissena polymorpha TaxID=45954 RepID=A0A9D4R8L0_DREPO|nr:hypothetical protein DPMN_100873 [Dreissena polymorpha]